MKIKRQKITVIVLAAGKGTRMGQSNKPKVLHNLAGKPLLEHVLLALKPLSLKDCSLVLGNDWQDFLPFLKEYQEIRICLQKHQNGTAGAVAACSNLYGLSPISYGEGSLVRGKKLSAEGSVLICYGDTPLLGTKLLEKFMAYHNSRESDLSILGMEHPAPGGYGRLIVNPHGELLSIVEDKDATHEQKKLKLCNSGILMVKTKLLFELLKKVNNKNKQNEYYLTDLVGLARDKGLSTHAFITKEWKTLTGVNTKEQLKEAEEIFAFKQTV